MVIEIAWQVLQFCAGFVGVVGCCWLVSQDW